jgi:hypothetical protein
VVLVALEADIAEPGNGNDLWNVTDGGFGFFAGFAEGEVAVATMLASAIFTGTSSSCMKRARRKLSWFSEQADEGPCLLVVRGGGKNLKMERGRERKADTK